MVPSVSVAEAVTVTLAHCGTTVLFGGAVKLTAGGVSTITTTTAEVLINPLLSVARAVNEYDPLTGLVHTSV